MHYIKTVTLAALAAISVSALPLGGRGLIIAGSVSRPVEDFIKRNLLPISSPAGNKVKRTAGDDDDGGFWADISSIFIPDIQIGAAGDLGHEPPAGTTIA